MASLFVTDTLRITALLGPKDRVAGCQPELAAKAPCVLGPTPEWHFTETLSMRHAAPNRPSKHCVYWEETV